MPEEIMVTGRVMQTLNFLIVSTSEKLVILKPFASSQSVWTGVVGTTADVELNLVLENPEFLENIWIGQGIACMFVGYPRNHVCDVNRILNQKTNYIIKSRNILKLN
jgi:hypothetical protein